MSTDEYIFLVVAVYGYREPYYSGYGKGHRNRWYGYRTYRYGNKRRYYRKKGKPYYGNYGNYGGGGK